MDGKLHHFGKRGKRSKKAWRDGNVGKEGRRAVTWVLLGLTEGISGEMWHHGLEAVKRCVGHRLSQVIFLIGRYVLGDIELFLKEENKIIRLCVCKLFQYLLFFLFKPSI